MNYKVLLIVIAIVLVSTTCTKDVYSPDACFQENILPIFISNCSMSGCHDGKGDRGYDFTNYDGIMKGITAKHPLFSEVYSAISGNASMPPRPYSKLNQKDISLIKIWIEMGAKNSSNCYACDTTSFTYSGRIAPLIDTWCKGCHQGSNAGGGYNFTNYTGLVKSVTDNKLFGSLKHQSGFIGMPGNGTSLSNCDIDAIQKWVNAGYPNN